ncbi:MAG: recombinase RecT [Cetobacterium sp.]|uniref:recombinase RecT n=1 Tax=Cetobacterium sp. TaxID=2071632 RepID=UPI002FC7C1F7
MTTITKKPSNSIKNVPSSQGAINPAAMMQNMLKENHKKLIAVLGDNANSFMVSAMNLYNTDLKDADPQSVMNGLFIAAALKLPIEKNMGFAYIIPYKNRSTGVTTAQFQLGYKGLMQLALRSGQVKKLNAIEIYDGQIKSFNPLTEEIEFDMSVPKGDVIGYAAYMELVNGFNKIIYVTKEDMERHADKFSQAYRYDKSYKKSSSVWSSDFDSMSKKTIMKMILKFAPLSADMQMVEKVDQASIKKVDVEIAQDGKGILATETIDAEYVDNKEETKAIIMATASDRKELLSNANTISYDIVKVAKEQGIDFDNMTKDDLDTLQSILDDEIEKKL